MKDNLVTRKARMKYADFAQLIRDDETIELVVETEDLPSNRTTLWRNEKMVGIYLDYSEARLYFLAMVGMYTMDGYRLVEKGRTVDEGE